MSTIPDGVRIECYDSGEVVATQWDIVYRTSPRARKAFNVRQWHATADDARRLVLIRDQYPDAVCLRVDEVRS